jgi:hypothetical protein
VFNDRRITLSIDENPIDETLRVYPTLVSSSIFFSKPIQSIKVINMLGKTFVSKSKVNLTELDLSHLSTGVYILHINQNQMVKILKK